MDFFLGSYTRMGGPGVALCSLDRDAMSVKDIFPLENATYVILNRVQDRLFAVSSASLSGAPGGSAASFSFEDGKLHLLSRLDTLGGAPCFPCLSEDECHLYVANYLAGTITVFSVNENGELTDRIQVIQHEGHGPNPRRQEGPHTHQVSFLPGTQTLCAVDLGIDALMLYRRDPATGLLSRTGRVDITPGDGPRHIIYGENGIVYLANEVESTVEVLRLTETGGEILQRLSTLPNGYTEESNTASAIRIHDGAVWVSNRGHDSIAAFDIGADGLLSLRGIYPTGDKIPRDFWFLDDGRVIIPHQAGTVGLYIYDGSVLTRISTLELGGCVCVLPKA